MGFRATMYGGQKSHYPWLRYHENEENLDNDSVLRNNHRIKTTQPISVILVFFSEDNVLSDEIKICYTFYTCTLNRKSKFPSDTFWYNSRNIQSKLFIKMHCMPNFLTHILSGYSLSIHIIVLWKHGIYESRCKKKVALFVNRPRGGARVFAWGGGGGNNKNSNFKISPTNYHTGVGVSSSCTWLTTELTSTKKK